MAILGETVVWSNGKLLRRDFDGEIIQTPRALLKRPQLHGRGVKIHSHALPKINGTLPGQKSLAFASEAAEVAR